MRSQRYELSPRLVVGADGRGSSVARQIGAHVQTDPVHHLMAGLLVERVAEWPMEDMTIGTGKGDGTFYIFPPERKSDEALSLLRTRSAASFRRSRYECRKNF